MVAGMPRRATELYIRLCLVAHAEIRADLERFADPEVAGIPSRLNRLVIKARDLLIDLCWHPQRRRLTVNRTVASIRAEVDEFRAGHPHMKWAHWDEG
jgi:hypothetical protein